MVRMLAIDPGTKCGYSWLDVPTPMPPTLKPLRAQSGVWDLSVKRYEGGGMRFLRMKKYIIETEPGFVLYEEVRSHKGTSAAHVYGGIIAIIQTYCQEAGIQYIGVPVGTIKKRATGKGNSGKPVMIAAANQQLIDTDDELLVDSKNSDDDNIADAMWLLMIGLEEYGSIFDEGIRNE